MRVLNPKCPTCSGRSDVSEPAFYLVFRTHPVRDTEGATPNIRSPAYLNKTRGIDCVLWCEIAP